MNLIIISLMLGTSSAFAQGTKVGITEVVANLKAFKKGPCFQRKVNSPTLLTAKADDDGDNMSFTLEETGDNPSSLKKFEFTNDSTRRESIHAVHILSGEHQGWKAIPLEPNSDSPVVVILST